MQMNEIRQRISTVEQSIQRAAQACRQDNSAPQQLQDSIKQLDQQCSQGKQMMQGAQDESQLRQYVEKLESLGDRAKQACEQSSNVSQELKSAVKEAHDELSNLKHQLH